MKSKHLFSSFFFIIILLTANTTSKAQAVNIDDSLALVNLYKSTNGSNWHHNTNWLKGPVSTWYGVTVDITGSRVIYLILDGNNLNGTLPHLNRQFDCTH